MYDVAYHSGEDMKSNQPDRGNFPYFWLQLFPSALFLSFRSPFPVFRFRILLCGLESKTGPWYN